MANRTWNGTGGLAGDWSVAANWDEVAVPVNGDDVFLISGSQAVTGGLAQGAVTLASLRTGPGYTGSIATSAAAALTINATTFDFASGGSACYIDGTFTTVRVSGGVGGANMLNLDGTITTCRALGGLGTLTIENGADLTTLEVIQAPVLTVVVEANVTSLATLTVDSGDVTYSSNCTTLVCRGGSVTSDGTATLGTLNLQPGGTVVYNSSGTLTTLNGEGGFLDGRTNDSTSVTITSSTIYAGCEVNLESGLRNWVLTNPADMRGGILRPDVGQTLTVA